MKSTIFVKPNLKLFVLAAVLIAVIQHFIGNGRSQASVLPGLAPRKIEVEADPELYELLMAARKNPTPQIYRRISVYFERRGDARKAVLYLRRAELIAQYEESFD